MEVRQIDVKNLANLLSASISTVRRDLNALDSEGFLIKYHGGAVIEKDFIGEDKLLETSLDKNIIIKTEVGQVAAKLIEDNDILFLGAGNTCWQIAKNIKKKKNIMVMTNGFDVVCELASKTDCKLIFCGGDVGIEDYKTFTTGKHAMDCLKSFYVNKAFFTVNGISIEYGYSINSYLLHELYSHLLRNTEETIIVADHTKFDKRGFKQLCSFQEVKQIVTNHNISEKYINSYKEVGVKLYTTSNDIIKQK